MNSQRLAAILWLAALAAASAWVVTQTSIRSDISSFMPRAKTPVQQLLLTELRAGPVTRITLISIGGASRDALAMQSKAIAARLRASGLFVRVANGEPIVDGAEREQLFAYRYLLSPAVDEGHFSAAALRDALQQRLRELASPLPVFDRPSLALDPTAELRTMLTAWRGSAEPRSYRGVWFDDRGERALLLAHTRVAGFDLNAQEQAQRAVREAAEAAGVAPLALGLSGPGVYAVASRDLIRAETRRLGIAATLVVMLIVLVSYRSLRLLLVGAIPLVSAVVAGVLAVDLVFGAVHGIALAFGVTVIGVAIDYPIHLFSRFSGERSTRKSLASIWPTIRLGVITTAMGYLAMTATDFPGMAQLATFAIAGLLAAAACTRWALLGLLPADCTAGQMWPSADWCARRRRPPAQWGWLLALAGLLSVVYVLGRGETPWQDDMAASSPIPASLMARDRHLHARLGVADTNHVLVIEAANAEAALQASESLAVDLQPLVAAGVITSFDHPARYLPSARTQLARRAILPQPDRLAADLVQAQAGLPFKADAFSPFIAAVSAARTLPPLLLENLQDTALGARVRSALLPVGDGWAALVLLAGVARTEALSRWLAEREQPNLRHLDLRRDTRSLMMDFRQHAFGRALWGLLAMVLVLWLGLRSAKRTIAVLAPGLLAVVIDIAALRMTGQLLSLFHLVSLLLVVGISIDYGLFFSRDDAHQRERARTFHGLVVCALSTVAVFGLLATSELPVLRAIGSTVAIGVSLSFVAALVIARPVRSPGTAGRI
ncbi:MAG: MMPL family transporter [Gammaproteobacteria bacterium]|nr:MMPL family transporter [Gammaproteobacteria bacterium]NIM73090.1 MMPL family transporter [Gammaproteobacteria bacterium]NIN38707.1 MMPL family transporter [Gammaproteobacteria bacterium]NIO24843.1 MMPL family transporter [Gammaproteobacteria bacterium]NIO65446.1 MMPL family transporter [Gammaproteobacteria bacterium]